MADLQSLDRQCVVSAPSRLHFGLFSFGDSAGNDFGGVGVMIDSPDIIIRAIRTADNEGLQIALPARTGAISTGIGNKVDSPELVIRIQKIVSRWCTLNKNQLKEHLNGNFKSLPVQVNCESVPPLHSGFGCGTQLTLAVIKALNLSFGIQTEFRPGDAVHYGRAGRSAIGSHGFFTGGLLIDGGKTRHQSIGELVERANIPEDWRTVLICHHQSIGESGQREKDLFLRLPAVNNETSKTLRRLAFDSILPAIKANDFEQFSASVFSYGHQAGLCFEQHQSGAYNGIRVSEVVEFLQDIGIAGVGQSSWGPCVFAWTRSADEAESLRIDLINRFSPDDYWVDIATPNNCGHTVQFEPE